jgi:hypothetical protein
MTPAIQRLAEMFAEIGDRTGAPDGLSDADAWRWLADRFMRDVDLVAVDHSLVQRAREAEAKDGGAIYCTEYDQGNSTDYGEACREITELVLAQLKDR